MGFLPEHFVMPDAQVWPELWPTMQVFFAVASSWRCGPSGPMSLDRAVVYEELRHRCISGEERDERMWQLSIVEAEALKQLLPES